MMPTIIVEDGFRVVVFGPPREHRPPHVHVVKGTVGPVIIRLAIERRPPAVWAVYGLADRDVLAAFRLVVKYHDRLLAQWRRIHG